MDTPPAEPKALPAAPPSEAPKYRDNLILTRLLLAIAVLFGHAFPFSTPNFDPVYQHTGLDSGWWAVNAFIAISGYCILQSRERSRSGAHFLWKRFLRVYPAYAVCMAILLLAYPARKYPLNWFDVFTFGPVTGGPIMSLNAPMWTVRIEECIYLSVALLFAIKLANKWFTLAVFLATYAAFLMRADAISHGDFTNMADMFLRLLPYFCAGALLQQFSIPFRWYLGLASAAILVVCALLRIGEFVAPIFLTYSVLCISLSKQIVRLPDLSYGFYLWNWPVLVMLAKGTNAFSGQPINLFFAGTVVCLSMAYLSHRLIEKPCQAFRERVPKFLEFANRTKPIEEAI